MPQHKHIFILCKYTTAYGTPVVRHMIVYHINTRSCCYTCVNREQFLDIWPLIFHITGTPNSYVYGIVWYLLFIVHMYTGVTDTDTGSDWLYIIAIWWYTGTIVLDFRIYPPPYFTFVDDYELLIINIYIYMV